MTRKPNKPRMVTVIMSCNHTLDFEERHAPGRGESLWCRKCGDYMTAVRESEQFTIRCGMCKYTRSFGRDDMEAYRRAGRHVVAKPAHKVMVRDGARLVRVVSIQSAQLPMGNALRQASVDGQSALRDFQDRLSRQRQESGSKP
jgi:DNA-directed RNA polymerase subunit M/transcription elongation factor TFIIS